MVTSRRMALLTGVLVGVGLLHGVAGIQPAAVSAEAAVAQAADAPPLWGTVRTASGEPMEGVPVSARAVGGTITTSVFTDDQGQYFFPPFTPPLESGQYQVWAQAVGYERTLADVDLVSGQSAVHDFNLTTIDDFSHQLSGTEWLRALPADTREHRRLKEIFRVTCTECHQAGLVLQNRFDERGWRTIIDLMTEVSYHGWTGGNRRSITIEYYRDELAKYLAEARGPESGPLNVTFNPRPTGEAARHVVTEYDIPIAELENQRAFIDGSDWAEGITSGMHGAGGMHDSVVDDDGNVWITDSVRNDAGQARPTDRTGHGLQVG